jgi:tetrapyrrole methylase family protein / MazG family protein
MEGNNEQKGFDRLMEIMRKLRAPGGCPWDAEQSHESLKRYLLEEAYEVIEAIDTGDRGHLKEELGDLLLQPVFHAAIAEEQGDFTMNDVLDAINEKLIRRHPHVFGRAQAGTPDQVTTQWDQIKQQERKDKRDSQGRPQGALHGVPRHLPALHRAHKIQDKAAKAGFDWPDSKGVLDKIEEEFSEVRQAMASGDKAAAREEVGDLLFAVAKLGRFLGHPPEEALHQTIRKFERRFLCMEKWLADQGKTVESCTLAELEVLWRKAKLEDRR